MTMNAFDYSTNYLIGAGGYLCLEAWFYLQWLNLVVTGCKRSHVLLPVDPVPPVLLATLLQQCHSERRELQLELR